MSTRHLMTHLTIGRRIAGEALHPTHRARALLVAPWLAAALVACAADVTPQPESTGHANQDLIVVPGNPVGTGPITLAPATSLTPPNAMWHAEIAVGDTTMVTSDSSNITFWDRYGNQKASTSASNLFQTFWKGGSPQNLNMQLPASGPAIWQQCGISTYGLDVFGNAPPDPLRNLHYQSSCLTNTLYDTHTTYDPVHHRFVIASHMRNMIWQWPTEESLCTTQPGDFPNGVPTPCFNNPGPGTVPYAWRYTVFAVSKTEDPTSIDPNDITQGFYFYSMPEYYGDWPRVGVSGNYFVASYQNLGDDTKPLVTLYDMDDLAAGALAPRQFSYTQAQLGAGNGSPGPLPWTATDYANNAVGLLVVPTHDDPVPSSFPTVPASYGTAFVLSRSADGQASRLFAFRPNPGGDRDDPPALSEVAVPGYAGVGEINAASIRGNFFYAVHQTSMSQFQVDQMNLTMYITPALKPMLSTVMIAAPGESYYDPMVEATSSGAAVLGYTVLAPGSSFSLRSTTLLPNGSSLPEQTWASGPACNPTPASGAPGCPDPLIGVNRISSDPADRTSVWILGGVGNSDSDGGSHLQAQAVHVADAGCATGTPQDTFYNGVVGCGGSVPWNQRQNLCGAGYTVCSAQQWATLGQTPPPYSIVGTPRVPTANYWTDDDLGWGGAGPNNCDATPAGTGNSCGTVSVAIDGTTENVPAPMRVCKPNPGVDAYGNTCNWAGCGLGSTTPDLNFGGCSGDATAGALCCPVTAGCANGAPDDVFPTFPTIDSSGISHYGEVTMVGCGGSVSYANRASLCGAGYSPCSASAWSSNAALWSAVSDLPQPSANYWTNDNLGYGGAGPSSCEASTSSEGNCGDSPMRVCTPAGTDNYGNACNWTGCGFNSTTNEFFGGCSGNETAGTLCCAN